MTIWPVASQETGQNLFSGIVISSKAKEAEADEKEYMARAVHNGINLFTITSAIHYHPKEKGTRGNIFPFIKNPQILLKPKKMSHFYYRNEGFIYNTYPEKRNKKFAFYMAYFLRFLLHFEFKELMKFIKYFRRGKKNDYR